VLPLFYEHKIVQKKISLEKGICTGRNGKDSVRERGRDLGKRRTTEGGYGLDLTRGDEICAVFCQEKEC